jgi:hypothetical protein
MDLQADIFVVIGYVRHIIEKEWTMVEPRVLLSVGKNGYIVSTAAPQYQPSDALLKAMTHHAEDLGFHFVLSPVNYRGWGGPTELGTMCWNRSRSPRRTSPAAIVVDRCPRGRRSRSAGDSSRTTGDVRPRALALSSSPAKGSRGR